MLGLHHSTPKGTHPEAEADSDEAEELHDAVRGLRVRLRNVPEPSVNEHSLPVQDHQREAHQRRVPVEDRLCAFEAVAES